VRVEYGGVDEEEPVTPNESVGPERSADHVGFVLPHPVEYERRLPLEEAVLGRRPFVQDDVSVVVRVSETIAQLETCCSNMDNRKA